VTGEARAAVERIALLIGDPRLRYSYTHEIELHRGIGQVLADAGEVTDREVILGPRDRIDFLLPDGVGIEVKVAGQAGDVLRQLVRYAASPRVAGLLLVTTRRRHVQGLPTAVAGKPLCPLLLRGGF
jgi:hypothetical protein